MKKAESKQKPLFGVVVEPLQDFLRLEAASGILLLVCAAAALLWANLAGTSYRAFFDYPLALGAGGGVSHFTLLNLINHGMMSVFFFVVGMEIKRELVTGELRTLAQACLPAIAAIGGVAVPAAIFVAFNRGEPGQAGWAIPMATDIAFCIGVLTLLKSRVPRGLIVFVTALAIFDDIAGILVIAIFYGHGLQPSWLLAAAGCTVILAVMNRRYVTSGLAYALVGLLLWYTLHHSGIHATIAGVILGLMIPARPRRSPREVLRSLAEYTAELAASPGSEELESAEILAIEERLEDLEAPLTRFEHRLHTYAALVIMPIFALANSGVNLSGLGLSSLASPLALGAGLGLFLGKQLGIFGCAALAIRLGIARMPEGVTMVKLYGASVIAGIGFTVALFVGTLAFPESDELLGQAKLGIIAGSLASGVVGFLILRATPEVGGDGPQSSS